MCIRDRLRCEVRSETGVSLWVSGNSTVALSDRPSDRQPPAQARQPLVQFAPPGYKHCLYLSGSVTLPCPTLSCPSLPRCTSTLAWPCRGHTVNGSCFFVFLFFFNTRSLRPLVMVGVVVVTNPTATLKQDVLMAFVIVGQWKFTILRLKRV